MKNLIARLEGLDREDLNRAGSKGASLGEMVQAGLPVPEGFAVLTGAYREFVAYNELQVAIQRLINNVPSVHEGTARVILNPAGARLVSGEVLVCRGADLAWTPLFLSAGALVMETGGAVSHDSVVAREYGLPAVAGVPHATERLQDGQRVRVNGGTGQVTVLDLSA